MFSMGRYDSRRYDGRTVGRYDRNRSFSSGEGFDDDLPSYRPTVIPSGEEESQDAPRYVRGERVRHAVFGSGTVLGLIGAGRNLKVEVEFDGDTGRKQLLLPKTGLERDWEGA